MKIGTFKMDLVCEECPTATSPHTVILGEGEQPDTFICQGDCRTFRPLHLYVDDGLAREGETPEVLFTMRQTDNLTVTTGWGKEQP